MAQIGLDEIVVPAVARKIIRDTVSSLRLDAVAASGFGTSRAKMAEAISSGRVTLNYLECTRPVTRWPRETASPAGGWASAGSPP